MATANIAAIGYIGLQASEFTIRPQINATSFADIAQIHDDVNYRKQIGLLKSGKFAYRTETAGAKVLTGGAVVGSEVWLEVERIYSQESQVIASYFEKFIIEQAKAGVDSGDLTGVQAAEQIVTMYSSDRGVDLERLLWAGNTAAVAADFIDTPGDAGATAVIKAAFFSTVTGLLTRIRAAVVALTVPQVVVIAATPTAAEVLGYFRTIFAGQKALLKGYMPADKVFICTSGVYDLFMTSRESFTGSDLSFIMQNDGTEIVRFRGIEIRNPAVINLMIEETGYGDWLPTAFIYLMSRDTMTIGADMYSPSASVDAWYSKDDDANYIRSKAAIGTQLIEPGDMIVTASNVALV